MNTLHCPTCDRVLALQGMATGADAAAPHYAQLVCDGCGYSRPLPVDQALRAQGAARLEGKPDG